MCAYACVVLDRQGVLIRYAGIPASVLAATGALMTDDRSSRSDMQDPGSWMLPLRAQTSGGEPVLTLNTGVRYLQVAITYQGQVMRAAAACVYRRAS